MPLGMQVHVEPGVESLELEGDLAWSRKEAEVQEPQAAGGANTLPAPGSQADCRRNSRSPRSPKKQGEKGLFPRSAPTRIQVPLEQQDAEPHFGETLVTPQPHKHTMGSFAASCSICDVILRHPGSSKCIRCVDLFSQILALEIQERDLPPVLEHLRMIKGMRLTPKQLNLAHPQTGMSFLHWFAWHGDAELCASFLQHKETQKNPRNTMGKTPLHLAVERGNLDCVQTLLDCRTVDAEATTLSGYTPLHLAALWGNVPIAEMLLRQRKVEPDPISAHGTPRELTKSAAVRRLLTKYGGRLLEGEEEEDQEEEQLLGVQRPCSRHGQGLGTSGLLRRDA